jgi:hypothetical protein
MEANVWICFLTWGRLGRVVSVSFSEPPIDLMKLHRMSGWCLLSSAAKAEAIDFPSLSPQVGHMKIVLCHGHFSLAGNVSVTPPRHISMHIKAITITKS